MKQSTTSSIIERGMFPIEKLIPSPINPRTIKKEKFAKLCVSIKKNPDFFIARPILCNEQMEIFAGNMRWLAAKTIGLKEVPAIVMRVDAEKQKELMLRDNFPSGEWNYDELVNFSEEMLMDVGFNPDDIFDLVPFEKEEKVDESPEQKLIKVQEGDMFRLGNHKVLCGDNSDKKNISRLLGNNIADLCLTDPPYNLNYRYNSYKDNKSPEEYEKWCRVWFDNIRSVSDQVLITCGMQNLPMWCAIEKPRWILSWFKRNAHSGCVLRGFNKHEPIVLYSGWEAIPFYGNLKKIVPLDAYEVNDDKKLDVHDVQTTFVEDFEKDMPHSCPKPVKLFANIIRDFTSVGAIVLDIFGGYGTTIIACEKMKRKCVMIEQDPFYVALSIKRWEDYTGGKSVKC
jgi:hypothetical protein